MSKHIFTGAGCAIVTPMYDDSRINYPEYKRLIELQLENGTDAIVVAGTTGEASTFGDDEHIEIIKFTVNEVKGRVPVIAGTGSNDTSYSMWLSKEAEKAGADALLQVTPYYNKTSQNGLVKHFFAIADAVNIPIILYNVPSRTGVDIKPQTYRQLIEHKNIVATKEASSNIANIALTMSLCGDRLTLYSGNDNETVPIMALGGVGVISVASNVIPRKVHDICKLFLDGKLNESRDLQLSLIDIMDALSIDVNPIPVKEALNLMGYAAGKGRLPLVELSESNREMLRGIMSKHGLV